MTAGSNGPEITEIATGNYKFAYDFEPRTFVIPAPESGSNTIFLSVSCRIDSEQSVVYSFYALNYDPRANEQPEPPGENPGKGNDPPDQSTESSKGFHIR